MVFAASFAVHLYSSHCRSHISSRPLSICQSSSGFSVDLLQFCRSFAFLHILFATPVHLLLYILCYNFVDLLSFFCRSGTSLHHIFYIYLYISCYRTCCTLHWYMLRSFASRSIVHRCRCQSSTYIFCTYIYIALFWCWLCQFQLPDSAFYIVLVQLLHRYGARLYLLYNFI